MNLAEEQKSIKTILTEFYKRGYVKGYKNRCIEEEFQDKNKYECGLNDAWECANKIYSKINSEVVESIFGVEYYDVFEKFTASEAVIKIKEYEEKQKQKKSTFKVGDRVRTTGEYDKAGTPLFPVGMIGEVIEVDDDDYYLVKAYGTNESCYYYPSDTLELANDVIIVGDEVWLLDKNYHGVITAVWTNNCGVVKTERLTQSGKLACDDAKDLHRTGRRFPEIVNVLKQMQEDKENG